MIFMNIFFRQATWISSESFLFNNYYNFYPVIKSAKVDLTLNLLV